MCGGGGEGGVRGIGGCRASVKGQNDLGASRVGGIF